MSNFIDLTGKQFERFTVIKRLPEKMGKEIMWECLCDCGKVKIVQGNNLRSGHIRSCGCLQEETRGMQSITHGHTKKHTRSVAYYIWSSMRQRCHNPKNDKYHYYGGRGITVCERWQVFSNFLEDMGQPEKGQQIDRIDNSKGYSKENCRWVTRTQNMRNKRNNLYIEFNGEKMCVSELAERTGIELSALYRRIREWGMPVTDAINSAINRRRNYRKVVNSKSVTFTEIDFDELCA